MINFDRAKFLLNSDETGRHLVYSVRTGKTYAVEPIDNSGRPADWHSYNPATGNMEDKKGYGKYTGSVKESESMITPENGFKNIKVIEAGSPYSIIEEIDNQYPDKEDGTNI